MNRKKRALLILLLCLAVLAAAGTFALRHLVSSTHYLRDEDVKVQEGISEKITEAQIDPASVYDNSSVTPATAEQTKDTYSLLVVGSGEKADSPAQCVILMVINPAIKQCFFASFPPNLYVNIPVSDTEIIGGALAQAYALGGGPLLAKTITANYGLPVKDYASISLAKVAKQLDVPEFAQLDSGAGGLAVVKKLVYSLGASSPLQVASQISSLMPYVTHNLSDSQLLQLTLKIPTILPYYSNEISVPLGSEYQAIGDYIVPDAPMQAKLLKDTIYPVAVP